MNVAGLGASLTVMPILGEKVKDIDIPDADLEISTMRSGGAGGQNVNKASSKIASF